MKEPADDLRHKDEDQSRKTPVEQADASKDEALGRPQDARAAGAEVEFVEIRRTPEATYELYRADSAESARSFLESKTVDQRQYYIEVETPEGDWGVDIYGLYLVELVPYQLKIDSAQCEGSICGPPNPINLQTAYNGIADNFVVRVKCGQCGHEWSDGIRYQNATVVRCPHCESLNKVDSRPHIVETGGMLGFSL